VSRSFTAPDGAPVTCGVAPGDCQIVVAGVRPGDAGLASVAISFATEPTSKAECRDGGWQRFVDVRGQPLRNQGRCISTVVRARSREGAGGLATRADQGRLPARRCGLHFARILPACRSAAGRRPVAQTPDRGNRAPDHSSAPRRRAAQPSTARHPRTFHRPEVSQ
jgi:hypothetical protein